MSYYLVRALKNIEGCEVHLVMTAGAKKTWELECDIPLEDLTSLADVVHEDKNLAATISSGSYVTDGMIIMPCSMKTLSAIANGYDHDLLARAADVTLKEGRPLVLCPRETPLNAIHLENMLKLSRLGVRIVPPMPSFYHRPRQIEDLIRYQVVRVLDQFGLRAGEDGRWGAAPAESKGET